MQSGGTGLTATNNMINGRCYWRVGKQSLDSFIKEIMTLFVDSTGSAAQTIFCHANLVDEININGIQVVQAPVNINEFILSGSSYDDSERVQPGNTI